MVVMVMADPATITLAVKAAVDGNRQKDMEVSASCRCHPDALHSYRCNDREPALCHSRS